MSLTSAHYYGINIYNELNIDIPQQSLQKEQQQQQQQI